MRVRHNRHCCCCCWHPIAATAATFKDQVGLLLCADAAAAWLVVQCNPQARLLSGCAWRQGGVVFVGKPNPSCLECPPACSGVSQPGCSHGVKGRCCRPEGCQGGPAEPLNEEQLRGRHAHLGGITGWADGDANCSLFLALQHEVLAERGADGSSKTRGSAG